MRVIYAQVSHDLVSPDDMCRSYYKHTWAKSGMDMPEHFMEIPTWIPIIAGKLKDKLRGTQTVHIVTDINATIEYIKQQATQNFMVIVMWSALEVNKHIIFKIIKETKDTGVHHLVGGYIDFPPELITEYVNWLNSVQELEFYLPVTYTAGAPPDYTLFAGTPCVPRITLSRGCLHACTFCSIPRKIETLSREEILGQLNAILPLDFKYVYIDDKTFGQASNYYRLREAYYFLKARKGRFQGFIVQTTVGYATRMLDEFYDMGVRYVEVGIEIPNDDYLRLFRKSYRVKELRALTNTFREFRNMSVPMGFIPNLIFGAPGDTYQETRHFVQDNLDIISFINPYVMTDGYEGQHKEGFIDDVYKTQEGDDTNENNFNKSWLTQEERVASKQWMYYILGLTV